MTTEVVSSDNEIEESSTFQMFGLTVSSLDILIIFSISIYLLIVLTLGIFQPKPATINSRPPNGRPLPGPWNFPIVGYLPRLGGRPFVTMWNLSLQYGSVYQIRMGSRTVVVVNGMEILKQAFVRQGKAFSGRPDFSCFHELSRGKSLTFQSYSPAWKVHSKMAAKALGSFVKNEHCPIDKLICRNAVRLTEQLMERQGVALDVYEFIEDSVLRVVYHLCFGDVVTDDFCDAMKRELIQLRAFMPTVVAAGIMPWLGTLLCSHFQKFQKTVRRFEKLIDDMALSAGTGVRDDSTCIVHSLIRAAEDLEADPGSLTSVDRDKILTTVHDLIGAGSEGVVNFIYWAIRYMIRYPEEQERLRAEIRIGITLDVSPVDKDRHVMPYVEGFIWEVIRHSSMSPLTLPHSTLEDTVLCDYLIPKGTLVYGNLYSAGNDPDTWNDPENFRPERFLDESGKTFDRRKLEELPCFGLGNRRCIGEALGRIEMFLFLVIIVQNCRFSPSDEDSLTMDGDMSLVYRSKPYKVVINRI